MANRQEPLFFLESFAGQAQATRSVQSTFPGKVTAAIDVKFSEKLDINTNGGMGTSAYGLKRVVFSHHQTVAFRDNFILCELNVSNSWVTWLVEISPPRAAIVAILRGDPSGFIHWLGVQCSTWVSTSRGSTGRSAANPHGLLESDCVSFANLMACRR